MERLLSTLIFSLHHLLSSSFPSVAPPLFPMIGFSIACRRKCRESRVRRLLRLMSIQCFPLRRMMMVVAREIRIQQAGSCLVVEVSLFEGPPLLSTPLPGQGEKWSAFHACFFSSPPPHHKWEIVRSDCWKEILRIPPPFPLHSRKRENALALGAEESRQIEL